MKKIQLFDVDGTLTQNEKDFSEAGFTSPYKTFSFWPLLSGFFAEKPNSFRRVTRSWNQSMKHTPDSKKDQSSFNMLERTIKYYIRPEICAEDLHEKSKAITLDFLNQNIIHVEAIHYINKCLSNNIICVLTTGSYFDGLQGFVNTLIEQGLLNQHENLILNGAKVDWENRILHCANVGQYKTDNLMKSLQERNIINPIVQAAFGDDPYINDKSILEMALPNTAFVIKGSKNSYRKFDQRFHHCTWPEFFKEHQERVLAI